IIVIDFIDMNQMKNRDAVLEHFRKELSKDRTKTYHVEISPLGLVEMTRQNVSEGVREILTSTCRVCEGRGVTVSAETHAIEVERAVIDLAAGLGEGVEAVAIETQPDVAKVLVGNSGKQAELDKRAGKLVRVFPDPDLQPNTFAVRATGEAAKIASLPEPLMRGTKHKVLIDRVDPTCEEDGIVEIDGVLVTVIGAGEHVGEEKTILIAACAGSRAFATLVKPARRRRRRGGRGRKKTGVAVGASGEALEESDADDGSDFEDEDNDDEFEDEPEEGEEDAAAAAAAEVLEDDERTEIPQRLVLLDEDQDGAEDDLDDDQDDDEDDDEVDEDEEGAEDGASEDSDDAGDDEADEDDESGADDDGDDDPDDDGGSDHSGDEDEASGDEASGDEDSHLDAMSVAASGSDDEPSLARRAVDDDRDEPSIDADGGHDDHLTSRGVSTPASVTPQASTRSESGSSQGGSRAAGSSSDEGSEEGSSTGPNGQRRRRRGSRGGRNRSRSGGGGGGARPLGDGGSGSSNPGASSSSSSSSSPSTDG
ncbi:MAG: ribonuclease, Rne/Rng family, partial [Thermoleophilia bacterium]|nr:ribonuclease, Rne/Rng family [Thermoleophilia bacterium]